MNFILLFIILLHCRASTSENQECVISVKKNFPNDNEPFLLKENFTSDFYLPVYENGEDLYRLKNNEIFFLACPGKNNHVNLTKKHVQNVKCDSGFLFFDEKEIKFKDAKCKFDAQPDVLNTKKICAGKGTLIEIGFEARGWNKVLTICHNIEEGRTYFTQHVLYKDLVKGGLYKRSRFRKEANWLFKGYDPNKSYKRTNQKVVFDEILGANLTSKFLNESQFLSRGHLTPVHDFPFTSWQRFTFVYSNAAPQWQTINGGNWKKLESKIRQNSKSNVYNIATGTFDEFHLQKNETIIKVTLAKGKIPVPKYFWKIVQNPNDYSCIAFVATNDPFISSSPQLLCNDICSRYNWPVYQKKLNQGFIYCCGYNELKNIIDYVPYFDCNKVLNFV